MLIKIFFLIVTAGCGDGTNPREKDSPIAEKSSVHCVLTPRQIKALQSEPLTLIRQVLTSESSYEKKPFAQSLSAWQACYEAF
jgi:hypothetical protein